MSKEHPNLGSFQLLKPAPGVCQECGVDHTPEMPHNQQSLYYQYDFYGKHGRWPTWKDAMEHCTQEMKDFWIKSLAEHGVKV